MARQDKRKKSVVDARVQWTLASRVVMHFCAYVLVGAVLGLAMQWLSNPLATPAELFETYWRDSAPMLIVLVCLLPVFIRDTLTLSNRVAGPITRMRHTMKQIGSGDDAMPLKFRKNDMWEDLPDLFNAMVARLREDAVGDSQPNQTDAETTAEFDSDDVRKLISV